jgi:hypothetical protein
MRIPNPDELEPIERASRDELQVLPPYNTP